MTRLFAVKGKLSPYCIDCGEQQSVHAMSVYVKAKERQGKNPLDSPRGGFRCALCLERAIIEMAEDEETPEQVRTSCQIILAAIEKQRMEPT